jgi:hypothetical protein
MEPGADPFGGSFPRFEQFRVGVNLIPPPENPGLYFRADFPIVLRLDDLMDMLVKPIGKLTALLARQSQQSFFDLFDAHGRQYTTLDRVCEQKDRGNEQSCPAYAAPHFQSRIFD